MKVRITVVTVKTINDSEFDEFCELSTEEIIGELIDSEDVFTSVQPVEDDEHTSECAFCGEPTIPNYPICETCYESNGDNHE